MVTAPAPRTVLPPPVPRRTWGGEKIKRENNQIRVHVEVGYRMKRTAQAEYRLYVIRQRHNLDGTPLEIAIQDIVCPSSSILKSNID